MYYILNSNVALRSWWLVPYAYYIRHERNARGLKKEEFELLSLCDGKHDIPHSRQLEVLIEKGLISPCKKEEYALLKWQMCTCDNRYFPAMNWMITGKCNYNCRHCFNAADNSPLMSEWTLEEANQLLDEAEKCGINAFTITGGEPMLHHNFIDIIEGIYKRNMYVEELNTNGHYINQETLDRLKAIDCYPLMKISFDGIGHHDWLRNRQGAEEDALRAIRLCVENGFRVMIQTNVYRGNVESMLPTAELMDSLGAERMRIIRTTEAPRWLENANGATLELTEYYDLMLEFVSKYIKTSCHMEVDLWQIMTLFPVNRSYRMRPVECGIGEYRDNLPVCRGNRGMVAVGANGCVYPCHQLSGYYDQHGFYLGNVKEDGLQPLLQKGTYLSEVCTTVSTLFQQNEKCRNCKYFKHCAGGCRAVALAITGEKLGSDPSKCMFYENGYYEKIENLMNGWHNFLPISVKDEGK